MEESEVRQELRRRIDYVFVRCDANGPTLPVTRGVQRPTENEGRSQGRPSPLPGALESGAGRG
jgi:hypothetical protein